MSGLREEILVLITERDTPDKFRSRGSIVHESFTEASPDDVLEKSAKLCGRYGDVLIGKVVPLGDPKHFRELVRKEEEPLFGDPDFEVVEDEEEIDHTDDAETYTLGGLNLAAMARAANRAVLSMGIASTRDFFRSVNEAQARETLEEYRGRIEEAVENAYESRRLAFTRGTVEAVADALIDAFSKPLEAPEGDSHE